MSPSALLLGLGGMYSKRSDSLAYRKQQYSQHWTTIGNKIVETLSSNRVIWGNKTIDLHPPLSPPFEVRVLLFSTGSLNWGTTLHEGDGGGKVLFFPFKVSKARFRHRSFHEPNLTHWIKHVKSSTSESIRNAYFNLEQLAQPLFTPTPARNFDCGTTLEQLWFRRRTFHVPNLMHKL